MFGIGLATICAAVAWVLALNTMGLSGEQDPFGLSGWYLRVGAVGLAVIGTMAISRYITHRSGRGLRLGLAAFVILFAMLLASWTALVFHRNGGTFRDVETVFDYFVAVWLTYGPAVLVSTAAFVGSELLTGRL